MKQEIREATLWNPHYNYERYARSDLVVGGCQKSQFQQESVLRVSSIPVRVEF